MKVVAAAAIAVVAGVVVVVRVRWCGGRGWRRLHGRAGVRFCGLSCLRGSACVSATARVQFWWTAAAVLESVGPCRYPHELFDL